MKQMFSNATVMWDENELVERACLINQILTIIKLSWTTLNRAVQFRQVETPILTNKDSLLGHIGAGFPMLETECGLLRPETTAGCIEAFNSLFPMKEMKKKNMPFCIWQHGKSFRNEDNPNTMRASKLRLREFNQLEFELFASADTKADYLNAALQPLVSRFGGEIVVAENLPHYSRKTMDWMMGELEVAGCSERTDWSDGIIYEVSIGIDRLLNRILSKE